MVRSALPCRSGCRAANQPAKAQFLQRFDTSSICPLLDTATADMSFNTARLSLSSKFVTPVAFRPSVKHTVRSRGALQVHNATLWSLMSKGKEIELTDTVGKKSICGVGGASSDQDKVHAVTRRPFWTKLRHVQQYPWFAETACVSAPQASF